MSILYVRMHISVCNMYVHRAYGPCERDREHKSLYIYICIYILSLIYIYIYIHIHIHIHLCARAMSASVCTYKPCWHSLGCAPAYTMFA